jgi:hypothetical protein
VQQCCGDLSGLVRDVSESAVASADVLEAVTSAVATIRVLEAACGLLASVFDHLKKHGKEHGDRPTTPRRYREDHTLPE